MLRAQLTSAARRIPRYPLFGAGLLSLALALLLFLGGRGNACCATLDFNQQPPVQVPHDSPAAALEEAFTKVAKAVSPAVVNISSEWTEHFETMVPNFGDMQDFFNWFYNGPSMTPRHFNRKQMALGSGFLITANGFLLTNGHVVGKAERITVALENGRTFPAQVVGRDEKTDIALLKIDAGAPLPCVTLGDSGSIEVGQWAIAIGNPFGLDHTLTSGVISAKGRSVNLAENSPYASYIQTDASINPGNSGGPLCNLQGEVIGINTAIYSQTGNSIGIGFAIPSNVARKVAVDLAKQGRVTRAGLGANIQPLDPKMASSFGLGDAQGALINNVVPGSAAEKAGLKAGDVLTGINGENITSPSDLISRMYALSPGDHVSLNLVREKRKMNVDVVLQSIDEAVQATAVAPTAGGKGKAGDDKARLNLGLTFQDLTPEIRAQLDASAPQGPVVVGVKRGGAAEAAGLRPGDIVLQAGDKKVPDAESLNQALRGADLKKGIRLFLWRDGVTMYCILQKN